MPSVKTRDLSKIVVAGNGENQGDTWFEPQSKLYFGTRWSFCISKDKQNCPCGRPNHWTEFAHIYDYSEKGSNPSVSGSLVETTCTNIDYTNRMKRTSVFTFDGDENLDTKVSEDVLNTKLYLLATAPVNNMLVKMHDFVKAEKKIMIQCPFSYQRAPSVVVLYLIKYHADYLREKVTEDKIDVEEYKEVEAAKLIVAECRPSVLGYSEGGRDFATYQRAFNRLWDSLY